MSLQEISRQLTEEIAIFFVELGDSNLPEEAHLLHRLDQEDSETLRTPIKAPH